MGVSAALVSIRSCHGHVCFWGHDARSKRTGTKFMAVQPVLASSVPLGRWCVQKRPAERACQPLCCATNQYRGVYWLPRIQKFSVKVGIKGNVHYAGVFANATEGAYAFDETLRANCRDPIRLKQSLNFPTEQEASYEESLSDRRSRCLKQYSNSAKGVESLLRFQHRFSKSPQASEFEIVNIPSQSRVDAVLQARGSKSGGLALQLKSSTCHNRQSSELYVFGNTQGYNGMLLVLIALDRDIVWMVPGSEVSQRTLQIRVGSQRDKAWRVSHIGIVLQQYFTAGRVSHMALQDALLQCGDNHITEEHSHAQLVSAFASVQHRLHRPISLTAVVDSVLSGQGHQWRIQEKAAHLSADGKYWAGLRKRGGCLGPLAYAKTDFDILIVSLLDGSDRLTGFFLLSSVVLARRRLIGHRGLRLRLYPPWAQPKFPAVARKHSWQSDHFVDLRSWNGKGSDLDPGTKANLTELLEKLDEPAGQKGSCQRGRDDDDIV
ncbi:unnamed protein product [Symbiodinium sp. CCMP2592]|nr:unnamed protein product [Symbiodinium sp. CCMP2592]